MSNVKVRVYDDAGRKVWDSKDEDVRRLFDKNTPTNTINPSLQDTIKTLNRKFR